VGPRGGSFRELREYVIVERWGILSGIHIMREPSTAWPRRFGREIALVLAGKAIGLLLLYVLFFAAPPRVPPIATHLFQQGVSP
jgi:hypothetical protein